MTFIGNALPLHVKCVYLSKAISDSDNNLWNIWSCTILYSQDVFSDVGEGSTGQSASSVVWDTFNSVDNFIQIVGVSKAEYFVLSVVVSVIANWN